MSLLKTSRLPGLITLFVPLAIVAAGCVDPPGTCVDYVACFEGAHWSTTRCTCVSDGASDGGACVQNVKCVVGASWSASQCTCVINPTDAAVSDAGCVDNILCVESAHWDRQLCVCAPNPDMGAEVCTNSGCGGGTIGCSSKCKPGCGDGQLCCPYSGGACILTDAGTCADNGGYSCATPTAAGVCPPQCYP